MNEFLIFIVSIIAAFVGSIGGGGGMISAPFYILMGVPPHTAIAINRFGGVGLSLGSLIRFWNSGHIRREFVIPITLVSTIGVLIGSRILLSVDPESLEKIIGYLLLVLIGCNLFIKNTIGIEKKKPKKKHVYLGYFLYFFVSILGGFFGGVGTFILLIYLLCFSMTMIEANATESITRFVASSVSLVYFFFSGVLDIRLGLIVFIGMIIGGFLGAHIQIKKGNEFVKYFMMVTVTLIALKLIFF